MPNKLTLVPNFFTLLGLSVGFMAILRASQGQIEFACWAVLVAALFDSIDGRLARMLRATSHFGGELDSLADMVSFGIAPAVVASFLLNDGTGIIVLIGVFYASCTAIRLARFNTNSTIPTAKLTHYFQGLPSPAAGIFVVTSAYILPKFGLEGQWLTIVLGALVMCCAASMVSSIPYPSFKHVSWGKRKLGRVPSTLLVLFVLAALVTYYHYLLMLAFFVFGGYWAINTLLFFLRMSYGFFFTQRKTPKQ